jgi:very-short-patch-repair endonuclease
MSPLPLGEVGTTQPRRVRGAPVCRSFTPFPQHPPVPNPLARQLRRDGTDTEHQLWKALRSRRFHGYKFRRQHPIGPFIVDFACMKACLAIELDGGQHAGSANDARRTAWLQAQGWRVIRFWNTDLRAHPEHVADTILRALRESGAPSPGAHERADLLHLSLRERSPRSGG